MLRDTCAISAIEEGVDIRVVSRMLGHKTTAMTERSYLQWTEKQDTASIEAQRAAIERRSARDRAVPAVAGEAAGAVRRALVN